MITSKLLIPSIGAAAMATALGLFMIKLIHVEFEAEVEAEPVAMFLKIEEPRIIRKPVTKKPERTDLVEIPPRLDPIDVESVELPGTPNWEEPDLEFEWKEIKLDLKTADTAIPDKHAQPILRLVPKVPDRALREGRSGHCLMRFNVNPKGQPFSVEAYECSHGMFEKNSVEATKGFKYLPKYQGGVPATMTGVETKITYEVRDENGKLLPS